jgi:hypothetical protein
LVAQLLITILEFICPLQHAEKTGIVHKCLLLHYLLHAIPLYTRQQSGARHSMHQGQHRLFEEFMTGLVGVGAGDYRLVGYKVI